MKIITGKGDADGACVDNGVKILRKRQSSENYYILERKGIIEIFI
jgi:hypothetical protein